jgi:hypothetical protein
LSGAKDTEIDMNTTASRGDATAGREEKIGEWSVRHLANASTCSHPTHGQRQISGPIRDLWLKLIRKIGSPTSDVQDTVIAGRPLRVMLFERGAIYWDTATDQAFHVAKPDLEDIFPALAPMLYGSWEAPFEEGVVGVHAALLHSNEVLFWTYEDMLGSGEHADHTELHGEWSLLNLSTGKHDIKKKWSERNQFCAGQCFLGDGRVLVVGGDRDASDNDRTVRAYNPVTRTWTDLPGLDVGRWYPTVVTAGKLVGLAVGGWEKTEGVAQGLNPTAQFVHATGEKSIKYTFDEDLKSLGESSYPFVFVLPGKKLLVHLGYKTRLLTLPELFPDLDFNAAKKLTAKDPTSRTYHLEGTAVLLPLRPTDTPPYRARVMLIGGGNGTGKTPAKATCEILDLGVENPEWKFAKSMKNPRVMPDAVLLPDGKVLIVNGSLSGAADGGMEPVYDAEMYDPVTDTWTTLAPMTVDRLYHATALLLPDAKVLSAGTDRNWNPKGFDYAHTQLEVFSPPYLFRGSRPEIMLSPNTVSYGEVFEVATNQAEWIKSAALLRNGSCTHSFNSDQRHVELKITEVLEEKDWLISNQIIVRDLLGLTGRIGEGKIVETKIPFPQYVSARGLALQAPPDAFVAPPGYYMLFLISNTGVPSIAKFIRLG